MKLSAVLSGVADAAFDTEISSIAYDSRKVERGALFVAIKGFKTNGHLYIDDALSKGAAAIIGEQECGCGRYIKVENARRALALCGANFYGHPASELKIIGVSGTNGKTSTTYLIESVLNLKGINCGVIGTNKIVCMGTEIPSERTTPESLDLQAVLAAMRDMGAKYVVMEVSSHSLALDRVYGIEFETAVFTNLTQDHLDFHKTMQAYAAAKMELFRRARRCVINIDDEWGERFAQASEGEVLTFGIDSPEADCRATQLHLSERGAIFTLSGCAAARVMRIGIPGRFSVYNALAAIGALRSIGIDDADIEKGLLVAKPVTGRIELLATNTPYSVIVDYAHTPDGLENVLGAIREFVHGKIITVFGCGGDRDRGKRPKMGKIAAELSDFSVVTSDNPRTEEPGSIIADITAGMVGFEDKYTAIENRRDAIAFALSMAESGDVVLLAGKGHETYQIFADKTIEFDERKVVAQILSKDNAG